MGWDPKKMNKILLYVNYIAIFFFVLLTIFAFVDTLTMYKEHGISYEATIIVDGKYTTKIVTVWEKLMGALFFLGLTFLLLLDVLKLMEKRDFSF